MMQHQRGKNLLLFFQNKTNAKLIKTKEKYKEKMVGVSLLRQQSEEMIECIFFSLIPFSIFLTHWHDCYFIDSTISPYWKVDLAQHAPYG